MFTMQLVSKINVAAAISDRSFWSESSLSWQAGENMQHYIVVCDERNGQRARTKTAYFDETRPQILPNLAHGILTTILLAMWKGTFHNAPNAKRDGCSHSLARMWALLSDTYASRMPFNCELCALANSINFKMVPKLSRKPNVSW